MDWAHVLAAFIGTGLGALTYKMYERWRRRNYWYTFRKELFIDKRRRNSMRTRKPINHKMFYGRLDRSNPWHG